MLPKRVLMGPGPSDILPEVLQAMAQPTIGHMDPAFIEFMDELNDLLRRAFLTSNKVTLPISAPGSAGMECCFANLLEPNEKVIIAGNGVFAMRMKENAIRCGAVPIMIECEWGTPIDPNKVEDTLKTHTDAVALAFVHSETSTGVRSDAKTLCALARQYNCLSIVDAVTTLAGIELRVDDWNIDAIYSGSQKCLSAPPGLSPVSFNERAMAKVSARKTPVQSWFLDLNLLTNYWGSDSKRAYHHTAPINALYALHAALKVVHKEGLENSWARHAANHEKLRSGLEAIGLEYYVEKPYRLPQLNAVKVPDGIDEAGVRNFLLEKHNLEIGAGLGPMAGKIWRIGLMGASCTEKHVALCLHALTEAMNT